MANLDEYNFMKETKYLIIRIIWACVYLAFIFITIASIVTLSRQFLNNPTITTLESAYHPVNTIPFPGVAICNINKISKKRAELFAMSVETTSTLNISEITDVIQILGRLYDFDYHASERTSIEKLHKSFELSEIDIITTMKFLTTPCEDLLLECSWKGVPVKCSKIFRLSLTSEGYCCTFNYVKKSSPLLGDGTPVKGTDGITKGLSVIINNDVEDYQYVPLLSTGVIVRVFNPTVFPDKSSGSLSEVLAPASTENFLEIVPTTIRTVSEVGKYPLSKRQCLFDNEKPKKFKGLYSQSDCNMECRIASSLALCQCIPFMIPKSTPETVCDLTNLACLNRYRNKWNSLYPEKDDYGQLQRERHDSLRCNEICYPSCDGTSYEILTDTAPVRTKNQNTSNVGNYTVVHLFYSKRFSNLYKQDVVYYWFEILSNFGGTFGLVVGMSLISVCECLVFSLQRLMNLRLADKNFV